MTDTKREVVEMWNDRASLGDMAGTRDLLAKELEMRTLLSCFPEDSVETVVDAGCGNGLMAVHLAKNRPGVRVVGYDNSVNMVEAARRYAHESGAKVSFRTRSVLEPWDQEPVDAVYTERTLINLPDEYAQRKAIENILLHLKPGGTYLMLENSQDGLEDINRWRKALGLDPVVAPWHNHYIKDRDVVTAQIELEAIGYLDLVIDYSSTYYFVSRVINAFASEAHCDEPIYDSPMNHAALDLPKLPREFGFRGQGRLWVWRRNR